MPLQHCSASSDTVWWFAFQKEASEDEVFWVQLRLICSSPGILSIRTSLIPAGVADCIRFFVQKSIQSIFNGLSDQAIQMLHNLFFIDFDGSWDWLFVFLRYIFHSLFPFVWFLVGIIINHGNRLFQASSPSNVRNLSDVIDISAL